ncbi:MAG: EamA family transporter [Spirochaetes bacterium]|nr:EamA family transporter [Spirochaetota bacterium]
MKKKNIWLIYLSYLTVYIVWGSTYFFIKVAVTTIPPFYVVGFRFTIGGAFFLFLAYLTGRFKRLPNLKEVFSSIFLGTFLLIGGNGLVTIAEQKVDSYLAALIIASCPLIVAIFDWLIIKKRITLFGFLGIFIGISGVSLLLFDGTSFLNNLSTHVLLVLCGVGFWAFATSMGHRLKVYPDSFINGGIQMLFVGIVSLIGVTIYNQSITIHFAEFSPASIWGLLYLAIIGNAAFCAFNYLLQNEPANRVVSYAFVNPLIAVLLGLFLGQETAVPFLVPGTVGILVGLFFMLYADIWWKKLKDKRTKVAESN